MSGATGDPAVAGQAVAAGARQAIVNGQLVLWPDVVCGRALLLEGSRILGLADPAEIGEGIPVLDAGGRFIAPGLIDLHIHGALGHTFNEAQAEAWATICRAAACHGVTSLLATVAAASLDDLARALDFCRGWMGADPSQRDLAGGVPRATGATVLGAHLEGPYLNTAQKGALDPHHIRRPDDGSAEALLAYADVIRIAVVAPELPGAIGLIRRLAALGIVPAAGHSSARETDVTLAVKAGLRHVTHIWSAMSTTVREGPWRVPGLLEAALAGDGLSVEMIADNKHLPPTLMKLAYKCIGPDRLCVISDATSGAGLAEGARFRMGDMTYEVHDGVGMLFDRTAFAGSTTFVNQMVPVLLRELGLPLPAAIRMLTYAPACVLGLEGHKGVLSAGADADIVIFERDFTAWRTMIAGRWVHVRETEGD